MAIVNYDDRHALFLIGSPWTPLTQCNTRPRGCRSRKFIVAGKAHVRNTPLDSQLTSKEPVLPTIRFFGSSSDLLL